MNRFLPLEPRNGRVLNVIIVARISTLHQDEKSLVDQEILLKKFLKECYSGPVGFIVLATQGSGETLDRDELFQLEEQIESNNIDLLLTEDLARICRRTRVMDFCELCEDHGARLIAVNDRVDTSDCGWRDSAFMSSWHHERSNRDTSNRIKRSLRGRFENRYILANPGPLYVVPDDAEFVDDIIKREGAEEIVEKVISKLEEDAFLSEVGDWLNSISFPVGGDCKKAKWDGPLVKARFLNPRIKGVEHWNEKVSVRINKTGRHQSQVADPSLLLTRDCPNLAFISADRFDRLVRKLEAKNSYLAKSKGLESPLKGRPSKRVPFPGQMTYCGICGRKFVFGGHGITTRLMCDGARQYKCWNGVTFDGPLAAERVCRAVMSEYENLPEFDEAFLKLINEEASAVDQKRVERQQQLENDRKGKEREIENFINFIAKGCSSKHLHESLATAEKELQDIKDEFDQLKSDQGDGIEIPSIDELKSLALQSLNSTNVFSWEFNKIMRKLIPRIVVFPCRLIDGGKLELRAKFRLELGGLLENEKCREAFSSPLEKVVTIDLFDPPQREIIRKEVIEYRKSGLTEKQIAFDLLGTTVTTVQRSAVLQRLMDKREVEDAYEYIEQLPSDGAGMRRQLHHRYNFDPLPDSGEL